MSDNEGAVPKPPRALTAQARRAVLREPKVRFWWVMAALMLVLTVGFTIKGTMQWWNSAEMIERAAVVKAVGWHSGPRIPGRGLPVGAGSSIEIEYEFDGRKFKAIGALMPTGKQYLSGTPFDIRVDKRDPTVWTNRDHPVRFWEEMIGAFVGIIAIIGCVLAAWLMQGRFRRMWVSGELREARVIDHRHAPTAPKSVMLVCAVRYSKDDRLISVFVPADDDAPAPGETIDLVINDNATAALVPSRYA